MIVVSAPPCTVFSAMQSINQKHHAAPEWEKKYHGAMMLLQILVDIYWGQVSRGKFFLHEHPATASSWDLPFVRELTEHPGVSVVSGDMCRCGMHLTEERDNQGTHLKKPTKWMTNSTLLATILGARCLGGHEHLRLEGSHRTTQAARYPTPLVQGILNACRKMKGRMTGANHSKDPVHFTIPESLRQTENAISSFCTRKQMSIFDANPPPQIVWIRSWFAERWKEQAWRLQKQMFIV